MTLIKLYIKTVSSLNEWIGKIISILVYPMMLALVYEVVKRYGFNHPTIWAHEFSSFLYAVFFLLGGSYALKWESHISVEILYVRLPRRVRALLDLITWNLFYLFVGIIFWQGIHFAFKSMSRLEVSSSVWGPPVWPIKLCIPIAALLMLLQGSTKTIQDIYVLVKGKELVLEGVKEESE